MFPGWNVAGAPATLRFPPLCFPPRFHPRACSVSPRIDPAAWKKLWGAITLAELKRLAAVLKDRSLTPAAQKIKSAPPFTQSIIVVNPKIDSQTQHRLQCSIRFDDVFQHFGPGGNPAMQDEPALWGVPFPGAVASKPRAFSK